MTTETVAMWGLFWKGTNTLACPVLYQSKGACSNAIVFDYEILRDAPEDKWTDLRATWRKMKPAEKYERLGMECRVAFSLECAEAKP